MEAQDTWTALDDLVRTHGLPERTAAELYDAALGFRIHRASYVRRAGVEDRTATRDLARLAELGLLAAVGQTKGRHYVAGPLLRAVRAEVVSTRPAIEDPCPWLPAALRTGPSTTATSAPS